MTASMVCLITALIWFSGITMTLIIFGAIIMAIINVIDNYKNKKNSKIKG